MSSEGYHEPLDRLDESVMDRHRAIASIMEELEAVDWYDQRVSATSDAELAAVLAHNRDEEKEHAAMTIEWLRRRDPYFDRQLRTYLFTDEPITEVESEAEGHGDDGDSGEGDSTDGTDGTAPSADSADSSDTSDSSDAAGLGIGGLKATLHTEEHA